MPLCVQNCPVRGWSSAAARENRFIKWRGIEVFDMELFCMYPASSQILHLRGGRRRKKVALYTNGRIMYTFQEFSTNDLNTSWKARLLFFGKRIVWGHDRNVRNTEMVTCLLLPQDESWVRLFMLAKHFWLYARVRHRMSTRLAFRLTALFNAD